jgi:nucleoid-associated protein YgaU
VIAMPARGWGRLPPLLPGEVFSRTLLLDGRIHLYAEFERLNGAYPNGLLRGYIEQLGQAVKHGTMDAVPGESQTDHVGEAVAAQQSPIKPKPETRTLPAAAKPAASGAVIRKAQTPVRSPDRTPPDPGGHRVPLGASSHTERAPSGASPVSRGMPPPSVPDRAGGSVSTRPRPSLPVTERSSPGPDVPAVQTQQIHGHGIYVAVGLLLVILLAAPVYFLLRPSSTWQAVATAPVTSESRQAPVPSAPLGAGQDTQPIPAVTPPASLPTEPEEPATVMAVDETQALSSAQEGRQTVVPAQGDSPVTGPVYQARIEREIGGITIVVQEPAQPAMAENRPSAAVAGPERAPDLASGTTRDPVQERAEIPGTPAQPAPVERVREEIVHVVVPGDTLWHIALRYVANPWRYPELARLSNIEDPDLIFPGDRVRIIILRESN